MDAPTTLPKLREIIKQHAVAHWNIAQKAGYSEAWFSKVLNARVKTPDGFLAKSTQAIVDILQERRNLRPVDAASGEDVPE